MHIACLKKNCVCVHLCVRELERTENKKKENRLEQGMKRLREEELKKKSKKPGKKDTKEESRRKSLLEGRQVCMCIPFKHFSINKIICETKYIQVPISTQKSLQTNDVKNKFAFLSSQQMH